MNCIETIEIEGGYFVEIHADDDAANPLAEYGMGPALVLHEKAHRHFAWTTDEAWFGRLQEAIERAERTYYNRAGFGLSVRQDHQIEFHSKYPLARMYACTVIERWLRAFHGIPVVLPVGAGEHSGTWVTLGATGDWGQRGDWDSGWVGWLFYTPEQIKDGWGDAVPDGATLEGSLRASFKEFADWVSGDTYGYVVRHEDHAVEDDSCWGFYGADSYAEQIETEIPAEYIRDGEYIRLDDLYDYAGKVVVGEQTVTFYLEDRVVEVTKGTVVKVMRPGYMRERFMEVIEYERAAHRASRGAGARAVRRQRGDAIAAPRRAGGDGLMSDLDISYLAPEAQRLVQKAVEWGWGARNEAVERGAAKVLLRAPNHPKTLMVPPINSWNERILQSLDRTVETYGHDPRSQDPGDETQRRDGTSYPHGRCDDCGAPCDEDGCTRDGAHDGIVGEIQQLLEPVERELVGTVPGPAEEVMELIWSDGAVSYVCIHSQCEFDSDNWKAVVSHYNRSADHPSLRPDRRPRPGSARAKLDQIRELLDDGEQARLRHMLQQHVDKCELLEVQLLEANERAAKAHADMVALREMINAAVPDDQG